MTRASQDLTISHAIDDLNWCNTTGIEHIATLAANRFPRTRWAYGTTNQKMADDITADTDTADAIDYADPTGEAAINGRTGTCVSSRIDPGRMTGDPEPAGDSGDDPTPSAIDSALELIYWSTDELAMLVLDNDRIDTGWDRQDKLTSSLSLLHRIQPAVIPARDLLMDRQARDHIDLLVYQHISETAVWLKEKGEALCSGSKRAGQPVPQPGDTPKGCVSCARDRGRDGRAYFEPIDTKNHGKRDMCRRCGDYTSGNGAMPPLAAVEYAHQHGKNWTNKIIEEAKRTERAS